MNARVLALVSLAAICVIWGTTYLAIKVALESIPPLLLGGTRYLLAGVVLLGALTPARGVGVTLMRGWRSAVPSAFLLLVLGNGGVIVAEQWVSSGLAALMVATTPFWLIAVERMSRPGVELSKSTMFGLMTAFCGVSVLAWPSLESSSVGHVKSILGIVCLQVACAGWALGSRLAVRSSSSGDDLAQTGRVMMAAGAMMTAGGTCLGEWQNLRPTLAGSAALLYLALVGGLVALAAYFHALRHLPVTLVSVHAYINPIVALVLGTIFLSEPLAYSTLAAAALILCGSAIVATAYLGRSAQQAQSGSVPDCRGPNANVIVPSTTT